MVLPSWSSFSLHPPQLPFQPQAGLIGFCLAQRCAWLERDLTFADVLPCLLGISLQLAMSTMASLLRALQLQGLQRSGRSLPIGEWR